MNHQVLESTARYISPRISNNVLQYISYTIEWKWNGNLLPENKYKLQLLDYIVSTGNPMHKAFQGTIVTGRSSDYQNLKSVLTRIPRSDCRQLDFWFQFLRAVLTTGRFCALIDKIINEDNGDSQTHR